MKITLPFLDVYKRFDSLTSHNINDVLRECLAASQKHPMYLEACDRDQQSYLFFKNEQIYSSGAIREGQLRETTIRDFLFTVNRTKPSGATCFEVNDKILHSLLILFQKKPALKLLSSLVDLDQVLDKIEEEGKSCIVSASQEEFLAILRYEKGEVKALCHQLSVPTPQDRSFREDFLVKIYTLSAAKPLAINVYEDLLVKYASDAKMIDETQDRDITELFLSKPPVVTLQFKDKEIGRWTLDKPVFKIGRTNDNDIVIDNLAVSRLHSVIEEDKGKYHIRDCDSLNGTIVNGQRVGRTLLRDGDEVQIGKHKLAFQKQDGKQISLNPGIERFDQTIIMTNEQGQVGQSHQTIGLDRRPARLVEKTRNGDRVFELGDADLTLGKDVNADIEISGLFVAKNHARITPENGGYVIKHLGGGRRVKVDGKPVKECVLKNNDRINIGNKEFVFHE